MINKTILNLKKLKSFHIHNGNYDSDIDRAIKALEQQSNMVSRGAYEQVMWERDVAIAQLKELEYRFGEKIKTDKEIISKQAVFDIVDSYSESQSNVEDVTQDIISDIMVLPSVTSQSKSEDIAKAFQLGLAFGFGEKYDEMDKVMEEVKKAATPQPQMECEGCIYEKTGNNSTYPCSHCSRYYTDKYKVESENIGQMNIQDLIKQLHDMVLLYGDNIILTVTDGQSDYHIKKITGKQCAKYFEPSDNVAEVVITIGDRK